jgi:glyoxylase-like metal-dependent hydrolase (beta-lactamase superfamily II)
MQTYPFTFGTFDCLAVNDGDLSYIPTDEFFTNSTPDELSAACTQHNIPHPPNGKLTIPCTVLMVNTGSERILIDSGGGGLHPSSGHLIAGLKAHDITPEDITLIFLSHGHWDHFGGVIDQEFRFAFPKARLVMVRREYDYWQQSGLPEMEIIRPKLELIDSTQGDVDIVTGLRSLYTPGHTFHHTGVEVISEGKRMFCVVDLLDHPIHIEHPTWHSGWELDGEQTIRTRQRIFARAADENALLHVYHFPFPGLGYIREGWRWEVLKND